MSIEDNRLTGIWKIDPADNVGESLESTTLEFTNDGMLLYTVHEKNRDQIIRLTFRIEQPGIIVTDQPSSPREERTGFEFTSDDTLVLEFEGKKTRYLRCQRLNDSPGVRWQTN